MTDPSPVLPDSTLREQVARLVNPRAWEPPLLPETYLAINREGSLQIADALMPLFAVVSAESEKRGAAKGVIAAQERLVMRDQFSKRTLIILDELAVEYIPEPEKGQNT